MSHRRWLPLILCIVPLLAFGQEPAATQSTAIPAFNSASPETDAQNPRAMQLSLDQAIKTAVERSLGVEVESYNLQMSSESLRGSTGIFDPLASAFLQQSSDEQPVASTLEASKSDRTVFNVGYDQLLPTGATFSLGFNNLRRSTNNEFTFVDPAYGSELGLNLTQPLLRDFGVDITRRGINLARNTLGISREAFRDEVSLSILEVEQAYLDLIYTRRNLDVRRQSLNLARDQERITKVRIDVGAAAPLDILEPQVAIAQREQDLINAEALVRVAEDRLRRRMNLPAEEWDRPILPSEEIPYDPPAAIDAQAAVARALELRPEMRQAGYVVQNRRIQENYARNQVLPTLDLQLGYGVSGLGPKILTDDSGNIIGTEGRWDEAFNQVTNFDFPGWSVGLNFGVPIRNISARAEARRAQLDVERSVAEIDLLKQNIAIEVRETVRNIETAQRQIQAARTSLDAAEKNVEAERKRYDNGMSTNFDVLRVQQDLADAQISVLNAMVGYRKALANFHRAVGDLPEARNMAVEEPATYDAKPSRFENSGLLNYGR